jgi:hypothetical protein
MNPNPISEKRSSKEIRTPKPEFVHGWWSASAFGARSSIFGLLLLFSTVIHQPSISAQTYSLPWHTMDGGGGTSTGGVYRVTGTIGQPDAGGPLTNGQYAVTGGFWALPQAVQTPGAPTLSIALFGPGQAQISWVPDTGTNWVLQETLSLSPTNWVNSASGSSNPVTVPATPPTKFYRLFQP